MLWYVSERDLQVSEVGKEVEEGINLVRVVPESQDPFHKLRFCVKSSGDTQLGVELADFQCFHLSFKSWPHANGISNMNEIIASLCLDQSPEQRFGDFVKPFTRQT